MRIKLNKKDDFYSILEGHCFSLSKSRVVTFVNGYNYFNLKKVDINNFDIFSDGFLLCFLENVFFDSKIDRVSFDYSSVADEVFVKAKNGNLSIMVLGGSNDDYENFKLYLNRRYGLEIIGRNGFFKDYNDFEAQIMKYKNFDIVIIGCGSPLQEKMAQSIFNNFKTGKLIFTCGAFISQTAKNNGDYYPFFFNRYNLRWLYRIFHESHVLKRVVFNYPYFILRYVFEALTMK